MEFRTKIDKILRARNLALYKLGEVSGLNSTLEKAYNENREMRTTTTRRFLQEMGISEDWWEKGQGDIFVDGGSYNTTSVFSAPERKVFVSHSEEDSAAIHRLIHLSNYILMHKDAWKKMESQMADQSKLLLELSEVIKNLTKPGGEGK
jgi:hypothetical protein